MTTDTKVPHGTVAWFEMLGEVMCEAASKANLSPDMNISVVEHYTDGAELGDGLFEGFRLDIINGKPVFRVGVRPDERGDITLDVTRAASRKLNTLHSSDLEYQPTVGKYLSSGEFRIDGDPSRLGDWLGPVHDVVVDRTI